MKKLWCIIITSIAFTFFSFSDKGHLNYWIALKGITKIVHKRPLTGDITTPVWYSSKVITSANKIPLNEVLPTLSNVLLLEAQRDIIQERRSCKFPKSARKLKGKIIHLEGWISQLPSGAYILTEKTYNPKNPLEWPSMDERIELDGNFLRTLDQKVLLEGKLKLNKHDYSRAFYILEEIKTTVIE
jgi:hypothetical protein